MKNIYCVEVGVKFTKTLVCCPVMCCCPTYTKYRSLKDIWAEIYTDGLVLPQPEPKG